MKAYSTYGTSRINAYKMIEETLNMKDVRVFDYIEDDEGRKKAVLNHKETQIAQAKQALFKKVRRGDVRILIGSTAKMGAGTNVQDKIIASHDIDCPWRPSDVGRILRTFKIKRIWR